MHFRPAWELQPKHLFREASFFQIGDVRTDSLTHQNPAQIIRTNLTYPRKALIKILS